jgi:hypothetical protein
MGGPSPCTRLWHTLGLGDSSGSSGGERGTQVGLQYATF